MRLLQGPYRRLALLAGHHRATYALVGISLLDGSIFPLPPDVLLIPLILAKPHRAWRYAILTILCSAIGSLVGYAIGHFAFDVIGQPIINYFDYQAAYIQLTDWFKTWGVFVIVGASVIPMPFKLWCITAGALNMSVPAFVLAVLMARTIRFSLVTYVVQSNQRRLSRALHWAGQHLRIVCGIVVVCVLGIIFYSLH